MAKISSMPRRICKTRRGGGDRQWSAQVDHHSKKTTHTRRMAKTVRNSRRKNTRKKRCMMRRIIEQASERLQGFIFMFLMDKHKKPKDILRRIFITPWVFLFAITLTPVVICVCAMGAAILAPLLTVWLACYWGWDLTKRLWRGAWYALLYDSKSGLTLGKVAIEMASIHKLPKEYFMPWWFDPWTHYTKRKLVNSLSPRFEEVQFALDVGVSGPHLQKMYEHASEVLQ